MSAEGVKVGMKKYKFITIKKSLTADDYMIYNNKSKEWIGSIVYYGSWKRHIFITKSSAVVWSVFCLRDVIDFIENQIPPTAAGRE